MIRMFAGSSNNTSGLVLQCEHALVLISAYFSVLRSISRLRRVIKTDTTHKLQGVQLKQSRFRCIQSSCRSPVGKICGALLIHLWKCVLMQSCRLNLVHPKTLLHPAGKQCGPPFARFRSLGGVKHVSAVGSMSHPFLVCNKRNVDASSRIAIPLPLHVLHSCAEDFVCLATVAHHVSLKWMTDFLPVSSADDTVSGVVRTRGSRKVTKKYGRNACLRCKVAYVGSISFWRYVAISDQKNYASSKVRCEGHPICDRCVAGGLDVRPISFTASL